MVVLRAKEVSPCKNDKAVRNGNQFTIITIISTRMSRMDFRFTMSTPDMQCPSFSCHLETQEVLPSLAPHPVISEDLPSHPLFLWLRTSSSVPACF